MKKKILTVCLIATMIATVFAFVACAEETPEVKEGTLYQSDVEIFWFGVGKAYIALDYVPQPAEPVEGEKYGNLFNLYVDSGNGYESWLGGTWSISEDGNELTVTATWDTASENATTLTDAESGVAKTYTAKDGIFEIKAGLPSAGSITFEVAKVEAA